MYLMALDVLVKSVLKKLSTGFVLSKLGYCRLSRICYALNLEINDLMVFSLYNSGYLI